VDKKDEVGVIGKDESDNKLVVAFGHTNFMLNVII
jgi:hypothetical protein